MAEHSSGGGQIWNDSSCFWLSPQKSFRWEGQMVSSLLSRSLYINRRPICSHLSFWSWQESHKPERAHCFLPSFLRRLSDCLPDLSFSPKAATPSPNYQITESKTVFRKCAKLLHNFTFSRISQIRICKLPIRLFRDRWVRPGHHLSELQRKWRTSNRWHP